MKAPDRVWLWWDKGCGLLEAENVSAHERPQTPASECMGIPPFCEEAEYIRRDAFPMEEIAQACHSSWLAEDLEDLLSRILSLLESDDE